MVINLAHQEEGDVAYKIFKFPDGEVQIEFLNELNRKESYEVFTRISNPTDLFILLQVGDILKRNGVEWNLYISYLMSQRMDRVMSFQRPFSLAVVAEMINSMNFSRIGILESHSSRTNHLFKDRLTFYPNASAYSWIARTPYTTMDSVTLVFPDAGARNRYSYSENGILFHKKRDVETGQLIEFVLDDSDINPQTEEFLFVDDLCDGGGTFLGELKILKEKYPNKKYSLCVMHNVNKEGLVKICQEFDTVYTTNSYTDWDITDLQDKLIITKVI